MEVITRKEAMARGLTRYFTGKPCKHGHVSERRTICGGCTVCAVAKQRKYYDKHRDMILQKARASGYNREYYLANKEDLLEKAKDYRRRNAAAVKQRKANYYEQNKQEIGRKQKQHREKNKERILERERERYHALPAEKKAVMTRYSVDWGRKNRDKRRGYRAKWSRNNKHKVLMSCRARQLYVSNATPSWACHDAILTKYKERERMTALTGVLHHVDHKIPLQGENVCGLHVAANLRVILARDNQRKHNKFAS
ncbi:MAG: hypothetical protein ACPF8W_00210 [Luminiphilus sp.]